MLTVMSLDQSCFDDFGTPKFPINYDRVLSLDLEWLGVVNLFPNLQSLTCHDYQVFNLMNPMSIQKLQNLFFSAEILSNKIPNETPVVIKIRENCQSLKSLKLRVRDNEGLIDSILADIFECSRLTSLDIADHCSLIRNVVRCCSSLQYLRCSGVNWDFSTVALLVSGCRTLKEIKWTGYFGATVVWQAHQLFLRGTHAELAGWEKFAAVSTGLIGIKVERINDNTINGFLLAVGERNSSSLKEISIVLCSGILLSTIQTLADSRVLSSMTLDFGKIKPVLPGLSSLTSTALTYLSISAASVDAKTMSLLLENNKTLTSGRFARVSFKEGTKDYEDLENLRAYMRNSSDLVIRTHCNSIRNATIVFDGANFQAEGNY